MSFQMIDGKSQGRRGGFRCGGGNWKGHMWKNGRLALHAPKTAAKFEASSFQMA